MKGASFAPTGEASALELVPTRVTVWVYDLPSSQKENFLHSKTPRKRLLSGRFVELVG